MSELLKLDLFSNSSKEDFNKEDINKEDLIKTLAKKTKQPLHTFQKREHQKSS